MAFVDDLNASLGNLNSSVNPNFQPTSQVGSYSAPSYTALNLPTFNFTPQDFASGSGSGNAPALQSALAQTGQQPQSAMGDFWKAAGNDALGVLNGISDAFNWVGHLPVINNVEGAWKGIGHGYTMGSNADNNGNGYAGPGLDLAAIPQALQEGWQGLLNPTQARQNMNQDINQPIQQQMSQLNIPLWARIGADVLTGSTQDPLTLAPIGPLVKGVGMAAKGIGSLLGKGAEASAETAPGLLDAGLHASIPETSKVPSLADLLNTKELPTLTSTPIEQEAPSLADLLNQAISKESGLPSGPVALNAGLNLKDNPVVRRMLDTLGKGFIKNYGTTNALQDLLRTTAGQRTADQFNIANELTNLADKYKGMNSNDMNQIGHVIEGTQTGNPIQTELANRLAALRDTGISDTTGTQAIKNTGILPEESLRDNYFSHIYNNVPNELKNVFPKENTNGLGGLSSKGTFTLPRTFETLQDAMNAGLKPELNPYKVMGQYLDNTSRAVNNAKLLDNIKSTPGLLFAKDPIDEVAKLVKTGRMDAEQAAARLGITPEDLKRNPFVQSRIPQLNGYYIRQNDENALRQFLEPKQIQNPLGRSLLGAFDTAQENVKKWTTLNSLVHGHNIAWNGLVLGGAKLSNVVRTMKSLMNGTNDEWLQRAMKAGAISADRGSFLNNLEKSIKGVSQPIRSNLSYALHGALWDLDKSLRTAIFKQAIEKGATDAEAAAKVNKFMIDYNNLTPFEEQVMSRIFPFYRWMKGNYPLQVKQWLSLKGFPKQAAYEGIKSAVNKAITGNWNNQQDQHNPIPVDSKIDTGIVLPDGSHIMVDPYSPADEPIKLINEGLLPTLFSKLSPALKEGILQATNQQYYPGSDFAPAGKASMANKNIREELPANVPSQLQNYNLHSSLAHLLNDAVPGSGIIGSLLSGLVGSSDSRGAINNLFDLPAKTKPSPTAAELLTKALGGFSSRDNPALDNYYQKKDNQTEIKNLQSLEKQYKIPVSKAQTKQAYKKIPYPIPGP